MNKKKILHIITSTSSGGAENSLYFFLKNRHDYDIDHHVLSLTPKGSVAYKVNLLGIKVESLDFRIGQIRLNDFLTLFKHVQKGEYDLVHCWMYHANLIGGFISLFTGTPCIWSIHHNSIDRSLLKRSTIIFIQLGAIFSRLLTKKIIYCSASAMKEHERLGYAKKGKVIPNGYDFQYFRPDKKMGAQYRNLKKIPEDFLVFGHAARFNPTKDHKTLINALQKVVTKHPRLFAILCGRDIDYSNAVINDWIFNAGLTNKVLLLGELNDLRVFYNAIDIFVLSSLSEALPNVVGEAMSSGVPCVVTNVGDCAYLVGETGLVVPPSDPNALADAIIRLITNDELRHKSGIDARNRIKTNFSIKKIARKYEQLYYDSLFP